MKRGMRGTLSGWNGNMCVAVVWHLDLLAQLKALKKRGAVKPRRSRSQKWSKTQKVRFLRSLLFLYKQGIHHAYHFA